ncbi:MAG: hypothetical protein KatS3mg124_1765 [Porticoccaceae bacterium]|nr:MAG: hypothetical protein KatS3mg124_1765 [Porticoccaceae bacterium]
MNPRPLDRKKLFRVGNLSIFLIGLGFAVRANIAPDLQREVFDPLDVATSATRVGEALGATFTGFALTLLFGSALVDLVGMRRMLLFAALGYLAGSLGLLAAAAWPTAPYAVPLVFGSLLLTGLGWGAVEAASNPMVAALFPEDKTHRLNILHAWWPGGIVAGGLIGVAIGQLGLPWEWNLLLLVLPALLLAHWVWDSEFPVTERVALGVGYREMWGELWRRPLYWVFWCAMFFTAAAELAPGQWVNIALTHIAGFPGILVLTYVSALMFAMRHFAGPVARRLSSVGLLFASCLLASLGLALLSLADRALPVLAAATVWGVGVCYLWPTMLAVTAERFPRGGALALGLMGFAGGLSIQFVLPRMGAIFDEAKIAAAGGVERLATLSGAELAEVLRIASVASFQAVALVPLALLPVFGAVWVYDRRRRG